MAARKKAKGANVRAKRGKRARRSPTGPARSARGGTRSKGRRAAKAPRPTRADAVLTRALRALRAGEKPTKPQARALETYLGEVYGKRGLSAREKARRAVTLAYFRAEKARLARLDPFELARDPRGRESIKRRAWEQVRKQHEKGAGFAPDQIRIYRIEAGATRFKRWTVSGFLNFASEDQYEEDRARLEDADELEDAEYWLARTDDTTFELEELLEEL